MVKKMFLFFIACAFAQAQSAKPAPAALPWCHIGVDPADSTRKPDWATECVVKVSEAMPVVMTTGSGRQARCLLPPLTPVVIDRETGKAKWVLQCGNPIVSPANWVPSGTRICGPEPTSPAPAPAAAPAAPAPAPSQTQPAPPTEVRVGGEVHVVHEGAVRLVHEVPAPEPAPAPASAPSPQPKKGWWSRNWRWIVPVAVAAGAGTAVALTRGSKNNTVYYQPLPPPLYRP